MYRVFQYLEWEHNHFKIGRKEPTKGIVFQCFTNNKK